MHFPLVLFAWRINTLLVKLNSKKKNIDLVLELEVLGVSIKHSSLWTLFSSLQVFLCESYAYNHLWLSNVCVSSNPEFTPSRGNTPIHHSFGTPRVNKTPFENRSPASMTAPSPTEKKKKLLELFRDSVRDDHERDDNNNSSGILNMGNAKKEEKPIINVSLPKSSRSTPYNVSGTNSVCSSAERTSNADAVSFREKTVKSMQGCLPSLSSCRSFSERTRKMSPAPAVAVNGKPWIYFGIWWK